MSDPPLRPSPEAETEVTEPKLARDEGPPQAEGTLETTPFVYILVFILGRSLSGRLTLRDPGGGTVLMQFRHGAPASVEMSAPIAPLGELFAARGLLAPGDVAGTVARAAGHGLRLGEHMVREGRATGELITELLQTQIEERCAALASLLPETAFAFHSRRPSQPRRFEPWDPLNALLATVRTWSDRHRIHATVRWLAGKSLALHPATDLRFLRLSGKEEPALDAMRSGSPTLEDLYAEHGEGLSSLLYTLAVTRQFAFGSDKGPPMALDRPPDKPPSVIPAPVHHPAPIVRDLPAPRPALATIPDGFDVPPGTLTPPPGSLVPPPPPPPPVRPPSAPSYPSAPGSQRTPTPAPRSSSRPRIATPSPRPAVSPPAPAPPISRKTGPLPFPSAETGAAPTVTRQTGPLPFPSAETEAAPTVTRQTGPLRMPTAETAAPPPAAPLLSRKTGPLPTVTAPPHADARRVPSSPGLPGSSPAPSSRPDVHRHAGPPAPPPPPTPPPTAPMPELDDAHAVSSVPPPPAPAEPPSVHAPILQGAGVEPGPPSIAPAPGDVSPPIAPAGVSQSIAFIDPGARPSGRPERAPQQRALPPPPPLRLTKPANLATPRAAPVRPAQPAQPAQPTQLELRTRAREEHKLAEEALERGDLRVADDHALAAVRFDPTSPEYAALQVWIAAKTTVELPEAVRSFSRILDEHPECQPALYYRGMLLKTAGKDRAALRDFITLVRLNPDHLKGLVEVKLLRSRMPK